MATARTNWDFLFDFENGTLYTPSDARDVVEEITYLREYTGPKPFAEDIRERMTSPANGSSLNAVAGILRFCKLSVHSLFPFRMISDTRIECRNAS